MNLTSTLADTSNQVVSDLCYKSCQKIYRLLNKLEGGKMLLEGVGHRRISHWVHDSAGGAVHRDLTKISMELSPSPLGVIKNAARGGGASFKMHISCKKKLKKLAKASLTK